jgi:hypothetical protein
MGSLAEGIRITDETVDGRKNPVEFLSKVELFGNSSQRFDHVDMSDIIQPGKGEDPRISILNQEVYDRCDQISLMNERQRKAGFQSYFYNPYKEVGYEFAYQSEYECIERAP